MLVMEIIVISGLKILKGISMEFMECLDKDVMNKKKTTFCTSGGRAIQITTGSNVLDY